VGNDDDDDARARRPVRNPNARHHDVRLPKKLRKRKWKIGAIKNFINAHVFGNKQIITEEVTSSRAAEKYSSKPPSTKEHQKQNHDKEDDDDDDDDEEKRDDSKNLKAWRQSTKSVEGKKGRTNEQKNERRSERMGEQNNGPLNGRASEQMREQILEYEPSLFLKLIWGLEQFSLSASDLNVVIFFFLLPWLRQLWH